MNAFMKAGLRAALVSTTILGGTLMMAAPAAAQTTTASVRGQVTGADGAPVSGATVTAVNIGTNQTFRATTDANGNYGLNGLRPASYDVTVTGADGTEKKQRISVGIGQSASLNVTLATAVADAGTAPAGDDTDIVVTAGSLVESRTSEVATNISQQQIRSLPQTDRNFLSFAALAPGVRYNDSENGKGFTSGASTSSQVNVFIDGVSLKNKLREGGVAGQQNSRGNPFGQLAVQEFRVLTQNYKAEYEQAGAAIITAVTKSGTNDFHGEVFGQYTGKGLSEKDYINKRDNLPEPKFSRKQYGISLGGPIIKDKLFFFGTYEGNDQDRAFNVKAGGSPALRTAFEASTGRPISDFEGSFVSPFRGDFYFGKLTLTPDERQVFDLSFSRRQESDIQNFGNITSYEAAENKLNTVDTYQFKWTYTGDKFVNEFNTNYLNYDFNPVSLNPSLPSREYAGVLIIGGKDSSRREVQQGYTIRDDFTYSGFDGHTIKFGARVEITDIDFDNQAYIQPRYTYFNDDRGTPTPTDDLNFSFPAEARLGLGNSLIQSSNTQVGLYLQDDWDVTDKLQLNIGLRWDYETNGFANEYITPASAAAALRALPKTFYFDPENYITDGHDRPPFKGAFAPRFGFSYDVKGDQSTVIFGGVGRYYDRNNFSNTVDELARRLNPVGVFRFSQDGLPRNGLPTVQWNNSYLTREGLIALRNTSTSGLPELFAVKNNAKPPVNDQASLGVRQKFGPWQASLTASYIRGRNGYTHLFATRNNNGLGGCCNTGPVVPFGYSNVLIGYDGLDTRYKAIYFTLDKNYTKSSGWGLNIAYTLSKAEQNGGDLFSLDGLVPDSYGWRPIKDSDERHRLVISGIVDLPAGFQLSTLTTLGSGTAYPVTDGTDSSPGGAKNYSIYPKKNCIGGVFAYCEVNLSLENRQKLFGDHEISFAVDLLNAFNNKNFKDFDGFFSSTDPLLPDGNALLTLPRRIQFRAGYRF
ncbi:TonB-dependent receptor [Sphingomonas sp. So64.6b]|uniref:TonB-dependent receptor n=1 Tax=Sphingomonas sp. So64.6b TaxID=2997354 RepID=UPI001FCE6658|nr:TonB-dependent receptor [Sphingomonas sp. So64.6b]